MLLFWFHIRLPLIYPKTCSAIICLATFIIIFSFYIDIQPNAFATELSRMISAKIGHRYFIITTNIFFLRNLLSPWQISSSILSIPTTRDTSRLVTNAAIGIITEFVRKSNRSKTAFRVSSRIQVDHIQDLITFQVQS